jgi:VanZ family protein
VPLALFASLRYRRPLAVLAAVSLLSVLIELVQAALPALGRACDTNDWLMNTVGAAVGALLAIGIIVGSRRRRRGHSDGRAYRSARHGTDAARNGAHVG